MSSFLHVGAWLSLVERLVRDQEAGGSNPLAPTISFHFKLDLTKPFHGAGIRRFRRLTACLLGNVPDPAGRALALEHVTFRSNETVAFEQQQASASTPLQPFGRRSDWGWCAVAGWRHVQ